jgi:hypothetical protein
MNEEMSGISPFTSQASYLLSENDKIPSLQVHTASEICTYRGTASAVAFAAQIFFVSGPCQRIYLHWFTSIPFLAPELLIWTFPPVSSFLCFRI